MKVLVIAAHPDDYELGMAGTILNHINKKDEVYAILATAGEAISKSENNDFSNQERKHETEQIAKEMGIKKLFFLGLKDTKILESHDIIEKIEKVILEVNPKRIYVHSRIDTHQDHRNLSNATLSAARKIKQILFYESPSTQTNFSPHFFIDITNYIEQKIDILNKYKTLKCLGEKRYLEIEAIKSAASFRGYQSNTRFAESFEVFRYLE